MSISATRRVHALHLLLGLAAFSSSFAQEKLPVANAMPEIKVDASASGTGEEISRDLPKLSALSCSGSRLLDQPTTVAQIVGGRVMSIKVLHYVARSTPQTVRDIMAKVWHGRFRSADCNMFWAEATFWTIESTLEFRDGKRGLLITDGTHVFLLDHGGKPWFFRLDREAP
ncbi:MAG: hypothetical protein WBL63_17180 [Candidatus Acidiferrum sp.]